MSEEMFKKICEEVKSKVSLKREKKQPEEHLTYYVPFISLDFSLLIEKYDIEYILTEYKCNCKIVHFKMSLNEKSNKSVIVSKAHYEGGPNVKIGNTHFYCLRNIYKIEIYVSKDIKEFSKLFDSFQYLKSIDIEPIDEEEAKTYLDYIFNENVFLEPVLDGRYSNIKEMEFYPLYDEGINISNIIENYVKGRIYRYRRNDNYSNERHIEHITDATFGVKIEIVSQNINRDSLCEVECCQYDENHENRKVIAKIFDYKGDIISIEATVKILSNGRTETFYYYSMNGKELVSPTSLI